MKKLAILTAVAATAFATPAMAQNAPAPGGYIAASGGYHDLGIGDELQAAGITDPKDGGFIYGVVGGFDFPVGDGGITLGLEGNAHAGSGAIDSDYGLAAKVGFGTDATRFFVKGGYQWINLDVTELTNGTLTDAQFAAAGLSDTVDDYIVGAGASFAVGPNTVLTAGVDTVSFDTVRGTVSVGFKF